ncbi:DNA/RNA nuclease SfsA [Clostridiisalibacter paucivorans]|uniref:DNA/RNA nuclease SfsA n=1 Tax=Clostridiisalibacter paucivorans TaxID=408753 RepID=UPI00047A57B4|nr:DNA/RNA nuclease SfsA [Clostridiisalibacter paucivorans]
MHISNKENLVEGIFKRRLNRFVAEVEIDGKTHLAHVPNSGRMTELLIEDNRVILRRVYDESRKTKYDLLMVYKNSMVINIDSRMPNKLLYLAFKNRDINYFKGYNQVNREVTFGNSRFDIGLTGLNRVLIEVKCVTLVEDGIAMFPDAPTKRGSKHVKELIRAKGLGIDCGIFFIIQREDASVFIPNKTMDPEFAKNLKNAYNENIIIRAITCNVNRDSISLAKEIPVEI